MDSRAVKVRVFILVDGMWYVWYGMWMVWGDDLDSKLEGKLEGEEHEEVGCLSHLCINSPTMQLLPNSTTETKPAGVNPQFAPYVIGPDPPLTM